MIRHTGGLAAGETSTKSSPLSMAICSPSLGDIIPNCSPVSLIRRISLVRIASLILNSLLIFCHLHKICAQSNYKKTDTMCPLKCVNSTSYTDCNLISVSHKVRSFGPLLKYENIFNSLIVNYTMFLNKLSNIIMIYQS